MLRYFSLVIPWCIIFGRFGRMDKNILGFIERLNVKNARDCIIKALFQGSIILDLLFFPSLRVYYRMNIVYYHGLRRL
jgi:hypothetical protein